MQTTTGNVAALAIINGPCREKLAINYGALGQGWRANATIGRAIRLIMASQAATGLLKTFALTRAGG